MEALLDKDTWVRTLALCGYLFWASLSAFVVMRSVSLDKPLIPYTMAFIGPFALLMFVPILQSYTGGHYFLPMALSIVALNLCVIYFTRRLKQERAAAIQLLEAVNRYNGILSRLLDEELNKTESYGRKELQEFKVALGELRHKDIEALK